MWFTEVVGLDIELGRRAGGHWGEGGHPFCSGVLVRSGVFWWGDVPYASPRCLALRRPCAGTLVIDAPAKIFR